MLLYSLLLHSYCLLSSNPSYGEYFKVVFASWHVPPELLKWHGCYLSGKVTFDSPAINFALAFVISKTIYESVEWLRPTGKRDATGFYSDPFPVLIWDVASGNSTAINVWGAPSQVCSRLNKLPCGSQSINSRWETIEDKCTDKSKQSVLESQRRKWNSISRAVRGV